MIPVVKAKLLEGKKGLIVGIANENSIAWGCAKAFRAFGAELAVTYLNDKAKKYVESLAREIDYHRLGNRSNHRPPAGAVRRR
jgi:enoyl-[acyl-carrier protein] reductase I